MVVMLVAGFMCCVEHEVPSGFSLKVEDGNNLSSNSFMNMMERQCIVLLVELGMRHHGAVNDCLVVSKDVTFVLSDWDTEVAQSQVQINDLVHASVSGNDL